MKKNTLPVDDELLKRSCRNEIKNRGSESGDLD